jgi:hypothetical protein
MQGTTVKKKKGKWDSLFFSLGSKLGKRTHDLFLVNKLSKYCFQKFGCYELLLYNLLVTVSIICTCNPMRNLNFTLSPPYLWQRGGGQIFPRCRRHVEMLDARSDMKQIPLWEHTDIRGHRGKFGRPEDLAPSSFAPVCWHKKKLFRPFTACVCTQPHKHSFYISIIVLVLLFHIPQHNPYQMTQGHILEDGILHSHCYWNLRYQISVFVSVGMQLWHPETSS